MRLDGFDVQVDPWLLSRLRLADRRELLVGRGTSPVQTRALEILILVDQVNDAKRHNETVKLALLGQSIDEIKAVFPTWFAQEDVDAADAIDRELAEGVSSVWEHEGDLPNPQDVSAVLAMLGVGGVLGVDLPSNDEGWV